MPIRAARPAKGIPNDRRIATPMDGRVTQDWERHFEIQSEHLQLLEQGVDGLQPLAPGATLGQVITQMNALLAVLQNGLR